MTVRELRQVLFAFPNQDAEVLLPDLAPLVSVSVSEDDKAVYLSDREPDPPDPYRVTGDPYAIPVGPTV